MLRRVLRNNGLTIVVIGAFLLFWFCQSVTGHRSYNADQREHKEQPISYAAFLKSGYFREQTFENWESEFLQMGSYVVLTVWLRQKGSPESKALEGDES